MSPDKFNLNQLLRYFLSGTVFIMSSVCASGKNFDHVISNAGVYKLFGSALPALTFLALLVGVTVYVIHRALIYPVLSRIASKFACDYPNSSCDLESMDDIWNVFRVPKKDFDSDVERWMLGGNSNHWQSKAYDTMAEWGSQVHFCYTSSLSVFSGLVIGLFYWGHQGYDNSCILVGIVIAAFACGMVSHVRLKHMECLVFDKAKKDNKDGETDSGGFPRPNS